MVSVDARKWSDDVQCEEGEFMVEELRSEQVSPVELTTTCTMLDDGRHAGSFGDQTGGERRR